MRRLCVLVCLGAMIVSSLPKTDFAVEIVPATSQDILRALGPDSSGLALAQDSLPDLFTLTASRVEESPKQFIVVEPYLTGRWKGGKAVIEYARDLSYTLVSVYDKGGQRQRIYSVRTKFTEHVARHRAGRPAPVEETVESESPARSQTPAESQVAERPAARSSSNASRPLSEGASSQGAQASVSYEWDETQGAYVPVKTNVSASVPVLEEARATPPPQNSRLVSERQETAPATTTVTRHRRNRRSEEITVASANIKEPDARTLNSVAAQVQIPEAPTRAVPEVWTPTKPKARSEEARPETKRKVKVANTTWVERRHEPKATPVAPVPVSAAPSPIAVPTKAAPAATDDQWVPQVVEETPAHLKSQASQNKTVEPVPVTEASRSRTAQDSEPPKLRRRHHSSSDASSESARMVALESPVKMSAPSAVAMEAAHSPAPSPAAIPKERAQVAQRVPPKVSAPVASRAQEPPAVRDVPDAQSEAQPPVYVSAPEPAQLPPIHVPAAQQEAVPSTEDLLAGSDHPVKDEKLASDAWQPKATPQPAPEPELPRQTVKVANIPKTPVDNSVDKLLKMAEQGVGGAPHDSDAWTPKKADSSVESEVDLNKELIRIRQREKQQAIVRTIKVKQDVNNPEEGVLPVSSFEKFSGPMYGRHREYERRFYAGKRINQKAPAHDFYVEEVDRKKEIHNVYYYQHAKGKAPRLVAVERHDKVSFLGNYDIGKEDAGAISTY